MRRAVFDAQGYFIVPGLLPPCAAAALLQEVKACVAACAAELGVSTASYLQVISRWHTPSPVTRVFRDDMRRTVQSQVEEIWGGPLRINKWNIITKNRYASGSIACHQDLPYSPTAPYAFSSWIALNPTTRHSGGLKVLPGSHRGPVAPAVDFWAPDFHDTVRASQDWVCNAQTFDLQPGDGVLFDSQLWHGSDENVPGHDRYALVIRWESPDFICPVIPPRVASEFGMWSCGEKTEHYLRTAMRHLHVDVKTLTRAAVLQWWIQAIQSRSVVIPHVQPDRAVRALESIALLDQAAALHQGGDGEGRLYPQLYQDLIIPLRHLLPQDPA